MFLVREIEILCLAQNESSFPFWYCWGEHKCIPIYCCQADFFILLAQVFMFVCSPSRNSLFTQSCSVPLSDRLLPTHLQNEGLSLNVCPELFCAWREGTVAMSCWIQCSVKQCKAVSTTVQTVSCSRDRVGGKRKAWYFCWNVIRPAKLE